MGKSRIMFHPVAIQQHHVLIGWYVTSCSLPVDRQRIQQRLYFFSTLHIFKAMLRTLASPSRHFSTGVKVHELYY